MHAAKEPLFEQNTGKDVKMWRSSSVSRLGTALYGNLTLGLVPSVLY